MKKIILSILTGAIIASANSDTTVDATMSLMKQGMNKINNGFMYNSKEDLLTGLSIIEGANSIFKTVDVKKFMHSDKERVTRNINKNLDKHIKELRKVVDSGEYSNATTQYSKVINDCISCHITIRGW
jgi:ABC-type transport system substrate-binding protein